MGRPTPDRRHHHLLLLPHHALGDVVVVDRALLAPAPAVEVAGINRRERPRGRSQSDLALQVNPQPVNLLRARQGHRLMAGWPVFVRPSTAPSGGQVSKRESKTENGPDVTGLCYHCKTQKPQQRTRNPHLESRGS